MATNWNMDQVSSYRREGLLYNRIDKLFLFLKEDGR